MSILQCTGNMSVDISLELYYGGHFSNLFSSMTYKGGNFRVWSSIDPDKLSISSIHHQLQLKGFTNNFQLYYKFKEEDMLEGMTGLKTDART